MRTRSEITQKESNFCPTGHFFTPPPPKRKKIPQKGENFFLKAFTAVFLTKINNSFNVKNALKQCVILLNKLLAVKNNLICHS